MEIYVLTANGNYEYGKFEIVGLYSTRELAEKAAKKLGENYFKHIEKWEMNSNPKYPRWS